ncbi:MAG: hypothetical protein IKG74_06690 [Firmicutes bacterium]|nr:hypothetical protein [Bacillota bacterium]
MKKLLLTAAILAACLLCACAGAGGTGATDSGDPEYEALTIDISGLKELGEGGVFQVSIAELRQLPQVDLEASYLRTTGLYEEFDMTGPRLSDVIALAGGDLDDYAAAAAVGRDGYYCLYDREVMDSTDLLVALKIDGAYKLEESVWPAQIAAQGQFGPYWVRQVNRIILYETIPEKEITTLWNFAALTADMEPYYYEYYGSRDAAMDLSLIFSRFDYVDSGSFFTMRSSDGFKKNEQLAGVSSGNYYIKYEGADAPTNVSTSIMLGMNVQRIAWFSTNADAVYFLDQMQTYLTNAEAGGETGVSVEEVLYEVGVETVKAAEWLIVAADGSEQRVSGEDLDQAVLIRKSDGCDKLVWQSDLGYQDVDSLLRITLAQ